MIPDRRLACQIKEITNIMRLNRVVHILSLLILLHVPSAYADVLDDILERGTVRIGVAEFVPWTMKTKSGDLIGFEIDIGEKIAADMSIKADFKIYEWEDIIPALQRGEIDVIAGGMAITPARALQVNFSRPIAKSGVGLATHTEMTRNIATLEELNNPDMIIATVAGTMAEGVCHTLFDQASVNVFRNRELAEKAVLEGRAHAYLAAMPEVEFLVLKNSDKLDLPIGDPLLASSEALAVKKGEQELLNFLNAWVTARQTDKWLATTHDYWFSTLDWIPADDE